MRARERRRGDISVGANVPGTVEKGSEIGRFGFGSTVIVLMEGSTSRFEEIPAGTTVRMGSRCPLRRLRDG